MPRYLWSSGDSKEAELPQHHWHPHIKVRLCAVVAPRNLLSDREKQHNQSGTKDSPTASTPHTALVKTARSAGCWQTTSMEWFHWTWPHRRWSARMQGKQFAHVFRILPWIDTKWNSGRPIANWAWKHTALFSHGTSATRHLKTEVKCRLLSPIFAIWSLVQRVQVPIASQHHLAKKGHHLRASASLSGKGLLDGMAVTCDHRIRSLATTNKKTGFGSLVTTKCGHLRPQNVTFADRANKTSTVHAVTCDHTSRSLATKNWDHLASLGSLVPMHGVGWVGGGGGGMITCLALAHILAEHITCIHARGGWGGGMITYLAFAHILAEHITCIHARGGWGGWGGMITCLALAHILAEHITCIHARGGWGGWGGMITCLALAHRLAEHITCIHARGWGGWGGMITCLALAHIQAKHTLHLHTY